VIGDKVAKGQLERRRVWVIGSDGSGALDHARTVASECRHWLAEGMARDISYAYRVAGLPPPSALVAPLRAPHHTVSELGVCGTLRGHQWSPGELALAHGGVLVLDHATEFRTATIELVARAFGLGFMRYQSSVPKGLGEARVEAHNELVVPTWFSLVVTTPPCPCGNRGSSKVNCSCTDRQVEKFHEKVQPLVRGAEVVRL
jgi:magnesium chelatase family protein